MSEVKAIRASIGLTQKQFSDKFGIPLRTVVNWENEGTNKRTAPPYVINMIKRIIELEGLHGRSNGDA